MRGKVIKVVNGQAIYKCFECRTSTHFRVPVGLRGVGKVKCPKCNRKHTIAFDYRTQPRTTVRGQSMCTITIRGYVIRARIVDYSSKGIGIMILNSHEIGLFGIHDKFIIKKTVLTPLKEQEFVVCKKYDKRIGAQFADGKTLSPMQRVIAQNAKK